MFDTDTTEERFLCNRFVGMDYPYRDAEFETAPAALEYVPAGRAFHALVEASLSMISSSYGWVPNRAWKVYSEAYAINAAIDRQAAGTAHDFADCVGTDCAYEG